MNLKSLFKGFYNYETYNQHPDAVIIINYKKNIVFWNKRAQKIFEFTSRDVIGKNIGVIFNEEIEKIYQNLVENKSTVLAARTKANHELFVEITCSNVENKEEVIISVRDVTKNQKIIEKLLIEYENMQGISKNKSKFIANLSHELRTPMHSVIGFSQALLDGLGGDLSDKQAKYVNIISRNANSLHSLLNSILDISRIEAGKMEYNYRYFDIVQLINSVVEAINPFLKDKKLDFSMDLADVQKRNIYSDENLLRQVLINLVSNAVKFTESGSVHIKATHPDLNFIEYQGLEIPKAFTAKSYLMVSVSDTGMGIVEEELNNIFDEYRQLDKSISKKFGGTGLGLAITRKILAEMNGVIWVESEIGQGATFSFIIPIEKIGTALPSEVEKTSTEAI